MNLFTSNPDFYPTPKEVIDTMMMGENVAGKTVLEPSAGSGNIVRWLQQNGANEVIACELDANNRKLLAGLCNIIAYDFLHVTKEQVSHVDYIVMNPPFSSGAEHILHAFDIAPAGCTVIALCNASNLENMYYNKKNVKLQETIELYGNKEILGSVFSSAERQTDVRVALVKLYKQGVGDSEFDGYFFDQYETDIAGSSKEGLMQYNFVRDIVNRYVQAVKMFDSAMQAAKEINKIADFHDYKTVIDEKTGEEKQVRNDYGTLPVSFGAILIKDDGVRGDNGTKITHEQYKKYLQKHYWRIIFKKLNMEKYATAQLRENINKFIEQQKNIPFTMGNIYHVLDIVIQTNGQRMLKALEEAFDTICSYSAENSTAGEKWKTNANYMINRKFIVPNICQGYKEYWHNESYPMLNFGYYSKREKIEDVCKALCFLTGRNYDDIEDLGSHAGNECWGEWFEWGFFRCKAFKKGTMHLEFLDEDVWYKFNYEVSKMKGWSLPKKTQKENKPRTKAAKATSMTLFGND